MTLLADLVATSEQVAATNGLPHTPAETLLRE